MVVPFTQMKGQRLGWDTSVCVELGDGWEDKQVEGLTKNSGLNVLIWNCLLDSQIEMPNIQDMQIWSSEERLRQTYKLGNVQHEGITYSIGMSVVTREEDKQNEVLRDIWELSRGEEVNKGD